MARHGGRLSERISLAIAIAIHVTAFAVVRSAVVRDVDAKHADASDEVIEVEEIAATEARADETSEPRTIEPAMKRAIEPAHASPSATRARPSENASAIEAPATNDPSPAPPIEPRPAPPSVSLTQLGLDGPNRFVESPTGTSWTIHDAEDGVRRSIAESLLKHDRSVGLGSEGPAIAAIEEVVVASTAAVNGRAVLSVAADALGAITSVACVDGDHAQWDAIAADILKSLGNKHLRSAPGGRGVEMRIEVTSREQLPSGRDPGVEVRMFHIPLKHGRGPKSTKVDILDVAPKIVIDDPEVEGEGPSAQASPVKFPKAHIEVVKLFGIDGDLVDIGAPARRVVHAKVLEEHPL